jgi:23S rRNA pseudouridine1911/1915/1917 synthase
MKKDQIPPDFRIVDEDESLLVVDKPPQLLVHPSKPDGPPTLWHGLCGLLAYELANGGQISIINRLDRETSGLTMVAKTGLAARHLGRAMMRREIHKAYLAIIRGWPEADSFAIDAPLVREGDVRPCPIYVKQCVHGSGKPCRTDIQVLQRFARNTGAHARFTIVRAVPLTGRMHQIRVHLAHAGHPLVGDKLYTSDGSEYLEFIACGWTQKLRQQLLHDRHALHSCEIALGGQIWTSPLPDDLSSWVAATPNR